MRITNGKVFTNKGFQLADVHLEGAQIVEYASATSADINAQGCYVIPGLIDIHFHGAMGHDFCDAEDAGIAAIARYEASRGITTIVPTTMTLPEERLINIVGAIAAHKPAVDEAAIAGINLEGPFISPDKVGAQNPAYVRAATGEEFARLQDAAQGLIKLVDIAPEQPGNMAFIQNAAGKVRISLAHTSANYAQAKDAFEAGARHMTHLFNAMPALYHRNPGPIAAGAERTDITPEIIADGVHIQPAMVRLAFKLFGASNMILISDSLRACGLGDGSYELGGQIFNVHGNRATIENGSLAGSVSDVMACLKTAVQQMEIPLHDAVRAATLNPARALGLKACGALEPGMQANVVVLDESLNIKHVILRGKVLS